jgi:hypothetical protein
MLPIESLNKLLQSLSESIDRERFSAAVENDE